MNANKRKAYSSSFENLNNNNSSNANVIYIPDDDDDDDDSDSNKSKNTDTKRNSPYQSMATNIVWYFCFKNAYNEEPPLLHGRIIDNEKKTRQEQDQVKKYKPTKHDIITRDRPIRACWTYEMSDVFVNKAITLIIGFWFLYTRNAKRYGASKLAETKTRQKKSTQTSAKSISSTTRSGDIKPQDSFIFAVSNPTDAIFKIIDEPETNYEILNKDAQSKHKERLIKYKLYLAILFELDLATLLSYIVEDRLTKPISRFAYTEFLKEAIRKICVLNYPKRLVDINIHKLNDEIKDNPKMYNVFDKLRHQAKSIKYNNTYLYTNPYSLIDENIIKPKPLNKFATLKEQTSAIYKYITINAITLKVLKHLHTAKAPYNATFITFTDDTSTYIFDMISFDPVTIPNNMNCVKTPTLKRDISQTSWYERLEFVRELNLEVGYQIIKVIPTTELEIYYNIERERKTEFVYIRTLGVGEYSLFIKSAAINNESVNRHRQHTSMYTRHKKLTSDWIIDRAETKTIKSEDDDNELSLPSERQPIYITNAINSAPDYLEDTSVISSFVYKP